jgi:hypothetical protein
MQQAASTRIDAVLQEVKTLIEQLLAAPRSPISNIPERQGAYFIYDKHYLRRQRQKVKTANSGRPLRWGCRYVDEHVSSKREQGTEPRRA